MCVSPGQSLVITTSGEEERKGLKIIGAEVS